jgi:hypothetical protein
MPSPSPKLGLNIFALADTFSTAQYNANWNALDASPGILVCTSTTRPTWGANQTGMRISETDTGLLWTWNGSAFARSHGVGNLGRVTRTSNISTTAQWTPPSTGTLITALTETVHPPPGNRMLMVVAEVPEVQNANGLSYLVLQRDAVILTSWPVWTSQETGSGNSGNAGSKGDYVTFDQPNEASPVYTLAFAAATVTQGTTTLIGVASRPIALTVIET